MFDGIDQGWANDGRKALKFFKFIKNFFCYKNLLDCRICVLQLQKFIQILRKLFQK